MVKPLTATISGQITDKAVGITQVFTVGGNNYTSYLLNTWGTSTDRQFGAMSATFTLNNTDGRFGEGGANKISVGDIVSFVQYYTGDVTPFPTFYGTVNKRAINKRNGTKIITLSCLDHIATLQDLTLDLTSEGTRVEVTNEVLTPTYLAAPNDDMAQLFNFANNGIATVPRPSIRIRNLVHTDNIDSQYDGFEIYYDVGQLKLGSSLNVRNNYEVLATYYYYVKGKYVEDVIEAIITETDGYNGFLYGESSAQAVIDNHLTDTINNITGSSTDIMVPNLTSETVVIETTLNGNISEGTASIILADATGFPTSGSGSINGDTFTWTGKSSNTLTGIPSTGGNSLSGHITGDYVKYSTSYGAGQVWYLAYDNLVTTLTSGDFTIPGGTLNYFDKRYGRILLTSAISVAASVTCNTNYSFKTLQATGIEINRISFREREVKNRFEAITKVKEYVAPNYVIMTKGDQRIWAEYLTQKTTADYTLSLESTINYLEDEDLYTRVLAWAKNKQPTNVMFGDEVDYVSDNEENYTGIAVRTELSYYGEEKSGVLSEWAAGQYTGIDGVTSDLSITHVRDNYINKSSSTESSTGGYVFSSAVTGVGGIILGDIVPQVFINGVAVDNQVSQQSGMPVQIKTTTQTVTEGGGKSKEVSVTTYYYYTIIFPHSSIVPNSPIYIYNNQGLLIYTVAANDPNVNYSAGIWTIPGIEQNDVAEVVSTASYQVLYSTDKLTINYEDAVFIIDKSILPSPNEAYVEATFEYWAIAVSIKDISHLVDGRRDTQFQLRFFSEPPSDFHLATLDLGASYDIQAIDIVGGFFKPDDLRSFDVSFILSMTYSTDNLTFYTISDKTDAINIGSGEAISLEESDLGTKLTARYLKFNLQGVEKVPYGKGIFVVALTELSVYTDITLRSEATLIATNALTVAVTDSDTIVEVTSTAGFTEPESGVTTPTAYIGEYSFTYTGMDSNQFFGCTLETGTTGAISTRVSQTLEGDTTVYDDDGLLPKLGDRVYKLVKISDRNLYLSSELDVLAKAFLREFYKNHSKVQVNIVYAPYLQVGQTVTLTDTYNSIDDNYFIESIKSGNGSSSLVLAKYPA